MPFREAEVGMWLQAKSVVYQRDNLLHTMALPSHTLARKLLFCSGEAYKWDVRVSMQLGWALVICGYCG
jgi:hypothetical protein